MVSFIKLKTNISVTRDNLITLSWNKSPTFDHLSDVEIGGVGVGVYVWKVIGKGGERSLNRIQEHLLDIRVQRKTRDVRDASLRTHVGWYRIGEAQWLIGAGLRHNF